MLCLNGLTLRKEPRMLATTDNLARRPAITKEGMLDHRRRTISLALLVAILPALLVLSGPAAAALGGNEASIAADQTQMKATRRIVSSQKYRTHEIQIASGTLVREYVSPQGQVFAVTWKGPLKPDLQQILGEHFADYVAAASGKHSRRGPVLLQQPGLVIQSGGHVRAFSGRAYIPQMIPAGVSVDALQ
jgi:hypothetical protein